MLAPPSWFGNPLASIGVAPNYRLPGWLACTHGDVTPPPGTPDTVPVPLLETFRGSFMVLAEALIGGVRAGSFRTGLEELQPGLPAALFGASIVGYYLTTELATFATNRLQVVHSFQSIGALGPTLFRKKDVKSSTRFLSLHKPSPRHRKLQELRLASQALPQHLCSDPCCAIPPSEDTWKGSWVVEAYLLIRDGRGVSLADKLPNGTALGVTLLRAALGLCLAHHVAR